MGGNVADYIIITKRAFTINAVGPELKNFDFGVPGRFLDTQEAIITFMLNDVRDARLRIDINGQQVVLRNYGTSNIDRCIQEVCDLFSARRRKSRIVFSVTRGSCTIGDVVLWFQRGT